MDDVEAHLTLVGGKDCDKHRLRLAERSLSKLQVMMLMDEVKRSSNEDFKQLIDDSDLRFGDVNGLIIVLTRSDVRISHAPNLISRC
jgi:hypothetical protein